VLNRSETGENVCHNIPNNIDIAQNSTAANRNVAKKVNPATPPDIDKRLRNVLGTSPRIVISLSDGEAPTAIDIAALLALVSALFPVCDALGIAAPLKRPATINGSGTSPDHRR
jgi:hypothetical protein